MNQQPSIPLEDAPLEQQLSPITLAAAPAWRRAEFILPIIIIFLHGMYYNTIGELASRRGVDFGALLETPLDHLIPFSVFFIIPYTALWFLPIFMIVILKKQADFDVNHMRRTTCGFVALIGACYALWIIAPVRMSLRLDEAALANYGLLGKLTLVTYQNASVWNACPSFHVAAPWFICRVLKQYTGKVPAAVACLTAAVFMATVGIRIHYVLDIVGGILIAEAVYRLVLVPSEKKNILEKPSSRAMVGAYVAFIVAALGIHRIILLSLAS